MIADTDDDLSVDEENIPAVRIHPESSELEEGDPAQITIETRTRRETPLNVNIELTQSAGNYIVGSQTRVVTIEAGARSAFYEVDTEDDTVDEPNGRITATIQSGTGYRTIKGRDSAFFDVKDNDADDDGDLPILSIYGLNDTTGEGAHNVYVVLLDRVVNTSFTVTFKIYDARATDSLSTSIMTADYTPGVGRRSGLYFRPTLPWDKKYTNGGVYTVEIITVSDSQYRVAPAPDNSVSSLFSDRDRPLSDLPTISIQALDSETVEGEFTRFSIEASHASSSPLPISVQVSDVRGSNSPTIVNRTATINQGSILQILVETPQVDNIFTNGGSLTATIGSGPYTIATSPNNSATVRIIDADPEPSINPTISISSSTTSITEGSTANFSIESSAISTSATNVKLRVYKYRDSAGVTNYIGNFSAGVLHTVALSQTSMATAFSVTTDYNDLDEANYKIKVELSSPEVSDNYQVANAPSNSAIIDVQDDDPTPVVSISSRESTITEGENAGFNITLSSKSASTLSINVRISESGNFLLLPASTVTSVVVSAESLSALHEITTVDDDVDEPNGSVVATIQSGTGYTISQTGLNSTTINIQDNDEIMTLMLQEAFLPIRTIIEGHYIDFRVIADRYRSEQTVVNIQWTQTGSFITSSPLRQYAIIEAYRTNERFFIHSIDDNVVEENGTVTVTLLPGENYVIDKAYKSATINIQDNDESQPTDEGLPEVYFHHSIVGTYEEGLRLNYIISYNGALITTPLNVNIRFTQTAGDYIDGSMLRVVTLNPGERYGYLSVDTIDDQIDEPNGRIFYEIQSGTGYKIRDRKILFIDMRDNDADDTENLPILSMVSNYPGDTQEGPPDDFEVYSDRVITSSLPITFEFTEIRGSNSPIITTFTRRMPANRAKLRISQAISHDFIYTNGGSLTLRVITKSSSQYRVAAAPHDRITRNFWDIDSGATPTVSIQALENEKLEGEPVKFAIAINRYYFDRSIPIRIQISDTRGSNSPAITDSTFTFPRGSTRIIYPITPHLDNVFTNGGSLTVSLLGSSNGRIAVASAPLDSVTVGIIDADPDPSTFPTISISSSNPSITEGSTANFSIESSAIVSSPTNVKLRVYKYRDDAGVTNFIGSSAGVLHTVALSQTSTTTAFSVATDNNDLDEANYKIKVELSNPESGDNYLVANAPSNSAIIEVQDDEPTPVVSISSRESTITEGENAGFNFTLSSKSASTLSINATISESGNFLLLPASTVISIVVSAESLSALHEIATVDDDVDEPNGSVVATIQTGTGYSITTTSQNTTTINIQDDDDEIMTVYLRESSFPIRTVFEGQNLDFRLVTDRANDEQTVVNVLWTQTGNFIPSDSLRQVIVINAYSTTERFRILSIDDDVEEENGTVTVTLLAGENYVIDEAHKSASINVNDNDENQPSDEALPELYISSYMPTMGIIEEGRAMYYSIYNRGAEITSPINVNVQLIQYGGNFVDGSLSRVVTMNRGETFRELRINTVDDQIDEPDGRVYAIIQSGIGYKISYSWDASFNDVRDNDANDNNDLPILSIFEYFPSHRIGEGHTLGFYVFSDRVLTSDFPVTFEFTDIRGANSQRVRNFTRTMRANRSSLIIHPSSIHRDNVFTDGGSITVKILDSRHNTYRVAEAPNDRISRNFYDSDPGSKTVFSIQPLDNEKREGESARFSIESNSNDFSRAVPIRVQISDTRGSNSPIITNRTVTIPAGDHRITINVIPQLDNVFTNGGSLTVSLVGVDTIPFEIASAPLDSVTVGIIDADPDPSTFPTISISSSSPSITEGSTANFSIESSAIVSSPTNVKLRVYKYRDDAGVTNFIGSSAGVLHTVALSQTSRTTTFSVATDNNDLDEANYKIKVELSNPESGDNYFVANAPSNSAIIEVQDDEPTPVVSISSRESTITEGENAGFNFTLSSKSASTLSINATISESGNFLLLPASTVISIVVSAESLSALHEIATVDDDLDEPNGSVVATIQSGTGYTISQTSVNSTTINIQDDDDESMTVYVSEATSPIRTVFEGQNLDFRLITDRARDELTAVNVLWTQTGNFIPSDSLRQVIVINAYSTTERFRILTIDDEVEEQNGTVTVTLLPGENYVIDEAYKSASINVNDNDENLSSDDGLPEVYIRSHTWGHVIEGATIGFEISYYWATAPATAPTNVNVQLFQYGGDYISGSMSRVVTLNRGRGSKWLNVQTVDDQIDEPDGHIYAIIQSGTGYKVRDSSNFEFVSVKDNDADDNNDLPMLSISAFHPSDTGEGKSPYLDVFSDRVVTSDLRIRFEYTDLRGANIKNVRTFTRTMRANTSKLRIEPTIRRDNVYTNGGSFTVRILDSNDNSYRVAASPNDRVSRNFRDILSEIPIPIVISIQPLENEKREGESARFSIQSDWWIHGTAPIRLQISDTRGSNSPTITYRTVSISNSGQLTVNVTPQMDNVFTNGGSLTVSLDRVSTIPLEIASAPINSATVRIIDADPDPSTLPTISISSSSSSITEGSTANFSIESSAIVSSPTNVKLRVYKYRDDAGVTNFIGSSTGELHTVALSQTSRTTTFSVATDNNDLDEANYKIKVELSNPESGDNYQCC